MRDYPNPNRVTTTGDRYHVTSLHLEAVSHYNYQIQAWIAPDGTVRPCGHPASMRASDRPCCPANRYMGMSENAALFAHMRAKSHHFTDGKGKDGY